MKANFFDPETMTVGHVEQTDGETWFHSTDGTMSREVGEGEFLIPYSDFAEFLSKMRMITQQRRDNVLTASGQYGNSIATVLPQNCDNKATRRDTSSARAARRKPPTAKQVCKAHAEVVAVLKDAKFIRETSGGTYRNFKDLPTNVPRYIVDEVTRRGINRPDGRAYTQETLSPVVAAMKITARPTVFRVCYLICLAVVIAVLITKAWSWFSAPDGTTPTETEQTDQQNKIKVDKDLILIVCKENQIQLNEFRIALIMQKTYTDKAALVAEVKQQYAAMVKAMQK